MMGNIYNFREENNFRKSNMKYGKNLNSLKLEETSWQGFGGKVHFMN